MNKCLWTPSEKRVKQSNIKSFINFLVANYQYTEMKVDYPRLHACSLTHKESL